MDDFQAKLDEAVRLLLAEVVRLRSGAGGHGGRSPEALALAHAITTVLDAIGSKPAGEG